MSTPVRFTHVRQPRLAYTVAYSFSKEGNTITAHYGVAQCSKADTFSRAEGRRLAQARLEKVLAGRVSDGNPRAGSFTVEDREGLSVGREAATRFEAARSAQLNAISDAEALIQDAFSALFGRR